MSINAKVICDSLPPSGVRLTTMELNYPRFIHSEFMTHRMFSRNASSSRAIPVEKMIKQVQDSPAMPIYWGKNKPGMQASEETEHIGITISTWEAAAADMVHNAEILHYDCELHKQIVNRLLEPFQYIKVIVTATEWDNFHSLRLHADAQPEIQELARCMREAMESIIPTELSPGEWHLPYVTELERNKKAYSQKDISNLIKCSVARCARVSYMNHDASSPNVEKDIKLADMLLEAGHMSPFEHIATPMRQDSFNVHAEEGITHIDKYDNLWSGNFRGWIQYRQIL